MVIRTVQRSGVRHALFAVAVLFLANACAGSDGSTSDAAAVSEEAATDLENSLESDINETSDRVEVRWFVGLGAGGQDEQIPAQEAVVAAFNESQDEIELIIDLVDNTTASDVLATQIAAGNPPDIIGPVGLEGSNAFAGQYADLEPLIESAGFDLTPYNGLEGAYRTAEGQLEGIPFATFPSAMFYQRSLFDEAGLPYPPASHGDLYGVGTEWEGEWDWDKVAEISAILTVDSAGSDATSDAFDIGSTEQWGYAHQWTTTPNAIGAKFGGGSFQAADGSAQVSENWFAAWEWHHTMIHEIGASPDDVESSSEALSGNVFSSGRVAMVSTHLWYTCCMDGAGESWDAGAMPSYQGTITSPLHGDTFRLHRDSEHLEEAFEVLDFFFTEASLDLVDVYGGMPVDPSQQQTFFDNLDEQFPQGVNWAVFAEGLEFPDVPNHQANMTNFLEADSRQKELEYRLLTDADLDLQAAADELVTDLDAIFAQD